MVRDSLGKRTMLSNQTTALVLFIAGYLSAIVTTVLVLGYSRWFLSMMLATFLCVLTFMTIVFIVAWKIRRTDLVDMAWGLAFIVAAVSSFMLSDTRAEPGANVQTLITLLVIVWGLRLAYIIYKRLRSHGEDKRYVELRKEWRGNMALNTYLRIFVVQAVLATIISTAVIFVNISLPRELNVLSFIGLAIWLVGFYFEAVGDAQLKRFLSNPASKGKLLTSGLWSFTRHPNYFGEATMWWGIFVIALSVPFGWFGIITPVIITYLLLFVSGVPMTEKAFDGRPGWEAYKARTSKFFPRLPRKS